MQPVEKRQSVCWHRETLVLNRVLKSNYREAIDKPALSISCLCESHCLSLIDRGVQGHSGNPGLTMCGN